MLCALIMAGGKGTRFWPLSTEDRPKQFLKLLGNETMIQMTVNRLRDAIPLERIFVVTGKQYVFLVKEQLWDLPEENIIVEPYGKNTAPCIALSAFHINKKFKDATIAVLPSDHLISDEKKFLEILKLADNFVEENNRAIVTLGMTPDRPETGYGYIKFDNVSRISSGYKIMNVDRFVEKPNRETAEEYIKDGRYLWNGGMFIWRASNILRLTNLYLENTFNVLSEIAATTANEYDKVLEEKYDNVDAISVDYGIMEKAEEIYVIPSDFGWDDVGNWTSLERYRDKDEFGNVKCDGACYYNSKGNVVLSDRKVVLNGVEDLIVVESNGYLMVSRKSEEQKIKECMTLAK